MCIRVKGQGNLMACGPGELRFRTGEALGAIVQIVQVGTVEEDRIPDGIGAGIQQGKTGRILRPVQMEGRYVFRGDLLILLKVNEIPIFDGQDIVYGCKGITFGRGETLKLDRDLQGVHGQGREVFFGMVHEVVPEVTGISQRIVIIRQGIQEFQCRMVRIRGNDQDSAFQGIQGFIQRGHLFCQLGTPDLALPPCGAGKGGSSGQFQDQEREDDQESKEPVFPPEEEKTQPDKTDEGKLRQPDPLQGLWPEIIREMQEGIIHEASADRDKEEEQDAGDKYTGQADQRLPQEFFPAPGQVWGSGLFPLPQGEEEQEEGITGPEEIPQVDMRFHHGKFIDQQDAEGDAHSQQEHIDPGEIQEKAVCRGELLPLHKGQGHREEEHRDQEEKKHDPGGVEEVHELGSRLQVRQGHLAGIGIAHVPQEGEPDQQEGNTEPQQA